MSKESEAEFKRGYQTAEKHYQSQVAALQAEIAHLNRSKGAAKYLIKALRAQVGGLK